MADSHEDVQLRLWSTILNAIAKAVDGTFVSKNFASPTTKGMSNEERRLPAVSELVERFSEVRAGTDSFTCTDLDLIEEIIGEAFVRGHEAREIREVRDALISDVGDKDLRAQLINYLVLDGFGPKKLVWSDSFEEFHASDRELEAIRRTRPKKNEYKELRNQFSDVEKIMGWSKPDRTRHKSIRSLELADHFEQLTQSQGAVKIRSSATDKQAEIVAPLDREAALEELRQLHDIQSKDACLRSLQRVRRRCDQFYTKFEHLKDVAVTETRLHSWIPDLSALPAKPDE